VTDALLNWETVKYFTNESLEQERYGEAIDGYQVRWALPILRTTSWTMAPD
jgi:ABC-type transport system involved in Fe-S cluster assembly fused permease/ATPase subunit